MIARLRNAAKTGTVTIRSHKYLDGKALGSFGKAYISLLNHHLRCYRSLQIAKSHPLQESQII